MKKATATDNFRELDEAFETKVKPFLYNNGEGKMVPIAQLVLMRNRDRPKHKQFDVLKDIENLEDYIFEDSPVLKQVTQGISPETRKDLLFIQKYTARHKTKRKFQV